MHDANGDFTNKTKIQYEDTAFNNLILTGYDLNNTQFFEVSFADCAFPDAYLSGNNFSGSTFLNVFLGTIHSSNK